MLGQVDVQQEVVLHLVEQLEALPVAGVVEALNHLPQLGLQLQEQLKKAIGVKFCVADPNSFIQRLKILGHKFNKRLESFAPCYSQSFLLADFKGNHTLLRFSKSLQKIRETRTLKSIPEHHFVESKTESRNQTKTRV